MPSPSEKNAPAPRRPGLLARFCLGALGIAATVLACMVMTARMPKPGSEDVPPISQADETAPQVAATPAPAPAVTPTPAVYAPFGAQYGYGGEALIPQTPLPAATPAASLADDGGALDGGASDSERAVDIGASDGVAPASALADDGGASDGVAPGLVAAALAEGESASQEPETLRKGSKGEAVVRLQQALIGLGYLDGAADGDFGSKTASAVVSFQAVNGLSADGIAGPQTLGKLYGGDALRADEAPPADFLVLVNRDHEMGKDEVPPDLVNIADIVPASLLKVKYKGTQANRTAVEALYKMLQDAADEGVDNWQVSSAYRTYQGQQELVEESVAGFKSRNPSWSRQRCLSATYQTTAPAGTSEHQTGLAFDITVPGVSFSGTEQQKWLHAHCYEYGFIVRYTEEKQKITGFLAESWHIRYVGTQAAAVMTYNNWCLEEYLDAMR